MAVTNAPPSYTPPAPGLASDGALATGASEATPAAGDPAPSGTQPAVTDSSGRSTTSWSDPTKPPPAGGPAPRLSVEQDFDAVTATGGDAQSQMNQLKDRIFAKQMQLQTLAAKAKAYDKPIEAQARKVEDLERRYAGLEDKDSEAGKKLQEQIGKEKGALESLQGARESILEQMREIVSYVREFQSKIPAILEDIKEDMKNNRAAGPSGNKPKPSQGQPTAAPADTAVLSATEQAARIANDPVIQGLLRPQTDLTGADSDRDAGGVSVGGAGVNT